jgi:hypothetical protein
LIGHILRKEDGEIYQRLPYFGTLRKTGREVDQETAGEDR